MGPRHSKRRKIARSLGMSTPVKWPGDASGLRLSYRNAGGGGDCMFHSISACIDSKYDHRQLRGMAAAAVRGDNVADVLMDMAGQMPPNSSAMMSVPPDAGDFSPERLWNACLGNEEEMVLRLRKSVSRCGNHMWGDATVASLLEGALDLNIVMLAMRFPSTAGMVERARSVYASWVDGMMEADPAIADMSDAEIMALMAGRGLTFARAKMRSRAELEREGGSLSANRQPVGTVRRLCSGSVPGGFNFSLDGYVPSRNTIVMLNLGNYHWVPLTVEDGTAGGRGRHILAPGDPARVVIDRMLSKAD